MKCYFVICGECFRSHLNVMTYNVYIFQTDYMSTLEKDFDYKEEHWDFIQSNIRKFCLQYGAGLFYTSVKEDKLLSLLVQSASKNYHAPSIYLKKKILK